MVSTEDRSVGRHVVQFYDHNEELAERVAGYLLGALEGGGAAIVIATEDHRREFESRLEQADADLTAARDSGAYLAMDVSQTVREFTRVRRRLRGPARYCPSRLCTAWAPLTRWRAAGG